MAIVVSLKPPDYRNWISEGRYFLELEVENDLERSEVFEFPLPPREYSAEDTFSVEIIPTEDYLYTEHQGILIHTILISGTFGLFPSTLARMGTTVAAVVSPVWGRVLDEVSKGTGFAMVHKLRQLLRHYANLKSSGEVEPHKVHLYFINTKDNDIYEVEPITFRVDRSARMGGLYNYTLTLRTKRVVMRAVPKKVPKWKEVLQFISRILNAINNLKAVATQVRGLVMELGLMPLRLFVTVANIAAAVEGFCGLVSDVNRLGRMYKASWEGMKEAWNRISDDEKREILTKNNQPLTPGLDLPAPVDTVSAKETLSKAQEELVRIATNPKSLLRYGQLFNALAVMYSLTEQVEQSGIFEPQLPQTYVFDEGKIAEQFTDISEVDYNIQYGNPPPFSLVRKVVVRSSDTIYSIAQRELGNWRYWRVIVRLNQLTYPYIWYRKMEGVKTPGDTLHVPVFGEIASPIIMQFQTKPTEPLIAEKDIQMGIDLFTYNKDLTTNTRKDLALAIGFVALEQSLRRRFAIPLGSLIDHPTFGTLDVGSKLTMLRGKIYRQLMSSLLEDTRIEEVLDLSAKVEGNVARLNILLQVSSISDILFVEITGK